MRRRAALSIGFGCALLIVSMAMAANNQLESYNAEKSTLLLTEAFVSQVKAVPNPVQTGQWLPEASVTADEPNAGEVAAEKVSIEIDGHNYIGLLSIPSLGIDMPVNNDISYPLLKTIPCRYYGSAETNNLIIAAHNYDKHFGRINKLNPGDSVTLSNPDGTAITYAVKEVKILPDDAVVEMLKPDGWDLTLFTCSYTGLERVTVRCEKINYSIQ